MHMRDENPAHGGRAQPLPVAPDLGREPCNCIERVDRKLTEYGVACETNLLGPARAVISTYKLSGARKKAPVLEASYCPFCGEKYPEKKQ